MSGFPLDLPVGQSRGLPPERRRQVLDQVLADRVAVLAQARAAAFPRGTAHLPALKTPASP